MQQHHLSVLLICVILYVLLTQVHSNTCEIAEEGTEISISCHVEATHQDVTWQLGVGRDRQNNISSCTLADGTCRDFISESFTATVRTLVEQGSTSYMSELKVKSASRDKTSFYCVKKSANGVVETQQCDLQVYVKPEKPQCQDPVLVQQGTAYRIKVVCTSGKLYPEGTCIFGYRGLPAKATVNKSFRNRPSTMSPGDYQLECELLVPVEGLDEGSYQFKVKVFPELTSWVEAAYLYGEWTSHIILNHTRIDLAPGCPNGVGIKDRYIMAGTAATCRCEVTLEGYPPGNAQWYTSNGTKIGTPNLTDKSSYINLEWNSNDKTPTYYCHAESVLKVPQSGHAEQFRLPYSPLFAIGPMIVNIGVPEPPIFDLCPQSSQTFYITCVAPTDFVIPSPLFSLIINDEIIKEKVQGQLVTLHKHYMLSYYHRPKAGGVISVKCRGENVIFQDELKREDEKSMTIREPPLEAPVLKTSDNQPTSGSNVAYVSAGSNVHVTCRVDGGFPRVEHVKIECGINTATKVGSQAVLSLQLASDFSGMECTCSAQHVTGCYDKWTQIALRPKGSDTGNNNSGSTGNNSEGDSADTLSIGLGVGLGLTLLIIIIGAAVFVILYKRRQKAKSFSDSVGYNRPGSICTDYHEYSRPPRGFKGPPGYPAPQIPASEDYDTLSLEEDPDLLKLKDNVRDKTHKDAEYSKPEDYAYKQPVDTEYLEPVNKQPVNNEYLEIVSNPPVYDDNTLVKAP